MVATIIALSNLAGVAVQFFYQFLGVIFSNSTLGELWTNRAVNVGTCLVFLAMASYVAYRGIDATERVRVVLVGF